MVVGHKFFRDRVYCNNFMKVQSQWSKIFKDIWKYRSRSLLVIFSIAVGIAAVGIINIASEIIERDLYIQYNRGKPSLLEIYLSPFQADLPRDVESLREVESAEPRRVVNATLLAEDGSEEVLSLNILEDYAQIEVNNLALENGSLVPKTRQILIERQAADTLGINPGDMITVEMPDEREYSLEVAGIVQDVYIIPYNLFGEVVGYVTMDTLEWMGENRFYNRLDIVVSENKFDRKLVLDTGDTIAERVLEPAGYEVFRIQIPGIGSGPGEHWAHNQFQGLLLILQII